MSPKSSFQSAEYRKALGTFATGITIVTATDPEGEPVGLTVNSFTSVSLEPPLILWCLANSSDNLAAFRKAPVFAINILASDQRELSEHFARKQKHKFSTVSYHAGPGGAPLLDGCATWLQCKLVNQYEAGDHFIFIGEVEFLETTGREPLLYHQGNYAMSLPLPGRADDPDPEGGTRRLSEYDLYSLLAGAVHSYQEQFDAEQSRLIENPYAARLLRALDEPEAPEATALAGLIQIPKSELDALLLVLIDKGLLKMEGPQIRLTPQGKNLAGTLKKLVRKHEAEAVALIGNEHADTFRRSLLRLIEWSRNITSAK